MNLLGRLSRQITRQLSWLALIGKTSGSFSATTALTTADVGRYGHGSVGRAQPDDIAGGGHTAA